MTNLYVIRHAEAEGNVFRRIDGHYNSRITHNGQRQIEALRKRFEAIHIDAVYASDLFRTCETAKAIYLSKGLPLHKDARLREVWLGRWEDLPFGYLDCFEAEQMDYFSHAPEKWYIDGCEPYSDYSKRFRDALADLAARHDGQTIAVFTHGCVSGEGMRSIFGSRMDGAGRCDNTGVSLLHWEHGVFSASYFYDNSHLTDEISTLSHQLWWRGGHDFNLWFRDVTPEDAALIDPRFPTKEGEICRVAMLMEQPVGYLSYSRTNGEISCLYLNENHRYRRRGDQLLGEAVCSCRAAGLRQLSARFASGNDIARAFFARNGAALTSLPDGTTRAVLEIFLPAY